ncbi:TenA family transcriptional regulator [Larsenimonas suaedae]|uniref:Iron-containing redox enzyme family protein n=1 Tax=Larsenimonas suaedae TaxID=1851019 RepID=A0ABU1GS07_9GAMM|nr:iron-containing redox enzyme family protein [Larsenimonas suaedae]MCM2972405.1 iron-containing redox enzyme family protein [Larsenimonas suaedae]MDR5894799.1 iron-containing redox enzyme family protein [Larsenimonas suaedae]
MTDLAMTAAPTSSSPLDNGKPGGFYRALIEATHADRQALMQGALIQRGQRGDISLAEYRAFLAQAYHHVRHTVSLMMACGAELSGPSFVYRDALRQAIAEYVDEEKGHEHWILDDLEATGVSRDHARTRPPLFETELMVAYGYDSVRRRHPLAMFGMVLVLEGTSTSVASQAGRALQARLELPESAFHYLFSHGELDISHMAFFAELMDSIEDPDEQAHILHAAKAFYRLYGAVHDAALADAPNWHDDVLESRNDLVF